MSCPQLTFQEIMEVIQCLKLLDALRQSGCYQACVEAAGLLETDLDSVRNLLDNAMVLAQKMEETCPSQ